MADLNDDTPVAPGTPNKYDAFFADKAQSDTSALQQSMFTAVQSNPDQKAKAINLAQQAQVPTSLAESNYEDVSQKSTLVNTKYDALIKNTPQLADWLKEPDNAGVAHDDLDNLSKLEGHVQDYSLMQSLGHTLNSSIASMISGVAKTPAYLNEIGNLPVNLASEAVGSDFRLKTPNALKNNFVTQYWDELAQKNRVPQMDQSWLDAIGSGDYGKAARAMATSFVAGAPQLATFIAGALSGYGEVALAGQALEAGAEKSAQNEAQGVTGNASTIDAGIHSLANYGFMKVGSFGVLQNWEEAIANQYGKQASKQVMTDLAKTLSYHTAVGAGSMGANSAVNDFADFVTGENPDALNGSLARAVDAAGTGAVQSLAMTLPTATISGIARGMNAKQAALSRDFYSAMGSSAEATKLRERLPQAQQDLISKITQGTPVENIYIPVDAAETYFQSKDLNPTQVMQSIGASDAYNEAKTSGTDIKIPLSQWVDKVVGTEHYQALQNDIKFDPAALTVNEEKAHSAAQEAEIKAVEEHAQAEATAPGQEIKRNIQDQLVNSGVSKRDAELYSQVYSGFENIAKQTGQDPLELFKQYGVEIGRPEVASAIRPGDIPGPEGHVLEQSGLIDASTRFGANRAANESLPEGYKIVKTEGGTFDPIKEKFAVQSPDGRFSGMAPTREEAAQEFHRLRTKYGTDEEKATEDQKYSGNAGQIQNAIDQSDAEKTPESRLERFKNRFGEDDKFAKKAIDNAQKSSEGPYVPNKKIPGIGFAPNFKTEPAGTIGEPRIQEQVKFGERPDPLAWLDRKYEVTKNLIEKHDERGIPLTVNTSSDLIGTDEYIGVLPKDATVNMYLLAKAIDGKESANRILFPVNPSRLRQEEAIQRLRARGIKVNAIEPTFETYIKAAGGIEKVAKELGVSEDQVKPTLKGSFANPLSVIQGGKTLFQASIPDLKDALSALQFDSRPFFTKSESSKDYRKADFEIKKQFEKAPKQTVSLNVEKAFEILKPIDNGRRPSSENSNNEIVVMKVGNRYGLFDGNHRLINAKETGLKSISATIVDLPSSFEKSFSEKDGDLSSAIASFHQSDIGNPHEPRAQIRISPNRTFNIDLLANADRSSFLHETGHLYLEVLSDAINHPNASDQIKKDFGTIKEWLGAKEGEPISREQHEQFARGFEAYLMEGKAPSSSLRRAFANFKVWLTNIYKTAQGLNVNLSDEVRGVFDRILASDHEVNAAELSQNRPFFGQDPMAHGMSAEQSAKYTSAVNDAHEAYRDDLQKKMMKDLTREQTREFKSRKQALTDESTHEIETSKRYSAIDRLQSDEPIEGAQPVKLDRSQIDPETAKELPRGIFSKDEGLAPDIAAEMLGYDSGDQMLDDLRNAPSKKDAIDSLVKQKIETENPQLFNSPKVSDEAMNSIHLDQREKVLRMQLEHLASNNLPVLKEVIRKIVRRVPVDSDVKAQAASIIGTKNLNDVKPYIYQRAESNMAKLAGQLLAKGDIDGAFDAKKKEYLNFELYRAAKDAQDTIKKSLKDFRKIAKSDEKISQTRDVDLVNAARAVLAQAELTKSDKTAADYLRYMSQYDPEQFQTMKALIDSVGAKPYSQMNYNDFTNLKTAVDALWSLAKSNEEMTIEGERVARAKAIENLSGSIDKIQGPRKEGAYDRAKTRWEDTKQALMGITSALRRVESWADAMDGGDIKGFFRKYMYTPISEGATEYRLQKKEMLTQLRDLLKPFDKQFKRDPIVSDELKYQFSGKAELLGALLHTGNDSNLRKLLLGRGWAEANPDGTIDRSRWDNFMARMWREGKITKPDHELVQNVWDMLEKIKPDAQKAHKSMYGYHFNEITASAVKTPFGEFKGGYFPAVADPTVVQDANVREERNAIEKFNNSWMFPTTGRGFTKSRVEYNAPLMMDLRLIGTHIDKVMKFTHIEPRVKDVAKLLWNKDFQKKLEGFDPTVRNDMLVPWLQRAATQQIVTPMQGRGGKAVDTFFREIRNRTGINIMAGNVLNALHMTTGVSLAALKVDPKYLAQGLWQFVRAPKMTASLMQEKSDFMKTRADHQTYELGSTIDGILLDSSKYSKAVDFAKAHGYALQQIVQNHADNIIWHGAYNQSVDRGLNENESVRAADSAVRQTQHSFNPEDISRFETGTAFTRAFTQFYSYFNMQANLLGTEFIKNARDLGLRKGAGKALYIYALGFMVPAFMHELIVQAGSGKIDQNNDDQYMDDFMNMFFGGQFRNASALFPIVGPVVSAGINATNNKWYDDRLATSPAVSSIESAVGAPHSVYEAFKDHRKDKKAIRDSLTALGLLSGLPVAPLARPLGYLSDYKQGKARPTNPFEFGRGLITGKTGE